MSLVASVALRPSLNSYSISSRIRLHCTFICVSAHQLEWVPSTVWTASVTIYTLQTSMNQNITKLILVDKYFFFFHHTTRESMCDTLSSSAANQGDNTVSVAQGGTATPCTTKQLLPSDRVFKKKIYIFFFF